jgi:hypothetical protein
LSAAAGGSVTRRTAPATSKPGGVSGTYSNASARAAPLVKTNAPGCARPRNAGTAVAMRTRGCRRRTRRPSIARPSSSSAAGTRHTRSSVRSLDQMPAIAITAVSITRT